MNFDYIPAETPDDCVFRISPSQVAGFFDSPVVWYREQILDESIFNGNTATVLGSIIHAFAESYAKGEPTSREPAEAYIAKMVKSRKPTDTPINAEEIRSLYPDMAMALINEYVANNMPTKVEYQTCAKVLDGIYVAGSVDNRTGSTITDYKNVSKAPTGGNDGTIPFNYKIQMLSYAYADKANGILTDRIRLVYTVRPTKTLPIRVFVVNHQITPEDWVMIEQTLTLIAETVIMSRSNPELTHLLFKSMNLKAS